MKSFAIVLLLALAVGQASGELAWDRMWERAGRARAGGRRGGAVNIALVVGASRDRPAPFALRLRPGRAPRPNSRLIGALIGL